MLRHCTDRDVACRSILIKNMMDDIGEQAMTEAIPIPNVSSICPPLTPALADWDTLGQRGRSQQGYRVVCPPQG